LSGVISCRAPSKSPIITSLSTRFFGHPKLTKPTFMTLLLYSSYLMKNLSIKDLFQKNLFKLPRYNHKDTENTKNLCVLCVFVVKFTSMSRKYTIKTDLARRYAVDYRNELNDEQYRVVTAQGGPILVIAGAGSGKTRAVTYRVARLLESGIGAEQILLVTFTIRAAREMLSRVEALTAVNASSAANARRVW